MIVILGQKLNMRTLSVANVDFTCTDFDGPLTGVIHLLVERERSDSQRWVASGQGVTDPRDRILGTSVPRLARAASEGHFRGGPNNEEVAEFLR